MDFLNDPEFIGGFFAFMDSEFVKCPHCDETISQIQLQKIFDPGKNIIICPSCNIEVSIDELKSSLE